MQKASLSPAFVPNSHRPPPREGTPETSREFLPLGDIRGVLTGAFSVELAGGKFKPGVCLSIATFAWASQVSNLCVWCWPLSVCSRKEEQSWVVVKKKGAAGIQFCTHHFPAVLL